MIIEHFKGFKIVDGKAVREVEYEEVDIPNFNCSDCGEEILGNPIIIGGESGVNLYEDAMFVCHSCYITRCWN